MNYEQITAHQSEGALEVISFLIAGQEFCVDISQIIEIRGWTPATPLAQAPDYVKGVISLRGVVMSVVDLSARLGMGLMSPDERNVIIVAQQPTGPVGLLVEAVCDTMVIKRDAIQDAQNASGGVAPQFVVGFLPLEDRMVTVLSLDHLIPKSMPTEAEAEQAIAAA